MRLVAGILIGAVAWFVAVVVLGFVLAKLWPEMAAVTNMKALTFPMQVARLCVSGLASIAGGRVASLVSAERFKAALGAGVLLLAVFVPYHLTIWDNFPNWYHLTFFASLPLLSLVGGSLAPKR
jgi:uncharacterized membrane protein